MALIMNKDSAVLQAAFLQADRSCLPSSSASLQKADWSRVARPVLQALGEICGSDEAGARRSLPAGAWRKRSVCVVWLKSSSREAEEDVETAWRENPWFSLQSGLPEVNYVVSSELVRSTAAAPLFARLLSHSPRRRIGAESRRLTEHVRSAPAGEEDVRFLSEVWRESWKGGDAGDEESSETMFADQFARSFSDSPHAAKRQKLDPTDEAASPADADISHILLHTSKDMSDSVSSTDVCLQSLCVSLDASYTSFSIKQQVALPVTEKLDVSCEAIHSRAASDALSPESVADAQRDSRASSAPSPFQPGAMTSSEASRIVTESAQRWGEKGLSAAGPCHAAVQLQRSVRRVLTASHQAPEAPAEEENALGDSLRSSDLPAAGNAPDIHAEVAGVIVAHRSQDYQTFAESFAGQTSWARADSWSRCSEENQAAFRQPAALSSLSSTLSSLSQTDSPDVARCRKSMKVAADIFSALPLDDKNRALAAMSRLSSRGFFQRPVPSAVTAGFEQELNMAFNCIIQGGGGASAAASQGNSATAVSLVARVAFQNPEAALKSCCLSAVFNKGAFSLMASISQQSPGLQTQSGGGTEGEPKEGGSSLCRCLQQAVGTKSMSVSEKQQSLKFSASSMTPHTLNEEDGTKRSFSSPQEVVNTFVSPNISSTGKNGSIDTEFSSQLLQAASSVEAAPSPHWVLGCSPFPLLFVLAQLYCQAYRCWDEPPEGTVRLRSMDTKESSVSVSTTSGQVVGAEVEAAPSSWSRASFWLYDKAEALDWIVRLHSKPVWGQHFKNEVPCSMSEVCDLPEQEWSGSDSPEYGPGTGLLAWMECCTSSDSSRSTMSSRSSSDRRRPDHVSMFSKGSSVASTQTLPWCSVSQWARSSGVSRESIASARLSVPFSSEYVDYSPLSDLRRFSCELRSSVLSSRVLQSLCGSSCSNWSSSDGWAHISRSYAHAVRDIMNCVKAKSPLQSPPAASTSASSKASDSRDSNPPFKDAEMDHNPVKDAEDFPSESGDGQTEEKVDTTPSQEVLFVLSQLFCHVQHIQVMMPGGQAEPSFSCSSEILSHYEAIMVAFPDSCSHVESDNTRHFFSTITDNLNNQHMKAVSQQKIAQLVSSAA